MTTISISSNGEISQDVVVNFLDLPVQQLSTFLSSGVPIYTSQGQPIRLPQLTSIGTAAGHVSEGSAIPEASAATDEVVLLPSTVWPIKTMLPITNEARRGAVFSAEAAFGNALTRRVADLIDASLYAGAGSGGAPTGLFSMTGFTNAGSVAGTALAPNNLYDVQEDYFVEYGEMDSALWVMSPANWTRVRKLQDSTGVKMLESSLAAGAPTTLLGVPVTVTTNAPDTAIILLDKQRLAIGRGPSTMTILSEYYANTDSIGIRVTSHVDVQPLSASSIVKLTIT